MSDERPESEQADSGSTSRRAVLAGAGAVGATAVLAACGSEPNDNSADPYEPAPPVEDPGAPGDDEGSGDEGGSDVLVAAEEVEVGGGVILADEGIVVTQPAEGEWRGFSATCTHEGCLVSSVADGTINCACHNSAFSIEDGSVVAAAYGGDPASQDPLPEVDITVADGQIFLT